MKTKDKTIIAANAFEFVNKHRPNLNHQKRSVLEEMLKDFAISQVDIFGNKSKNK